MEPDNKDTSWMGLLALAAGLAVIVAIAWVTKGG